MLVFVNSLVSPDLFQKASPHYSLVSSVCDNEIISVGLYYTDV